jgi:hypothetical protein
MILILAKANNSLRDKIKAFILRFRKPYHFQPLRIKYAYLIMKRNINLVILGCEIAAIIILHAFKMNQQQLNTDPNRGITKTNTITPQVKHYPLLSIK